MPLTALVQSRLFRDIDSRYITYGMEAEDFRNVVRRFYSSTHWRETTGTHIPSIELISEAKAASYNGVAGCWRLERLEGETHRVNVESLGQYEI